MRKSIFLIAVLLLCCLLCGSVCAAEYTVVRCTDQVTYPFSATVSGAVGVTVKDINNNYYRYYPTTDTITALAGSPAGYSWDVVYQTGYISNDGSAVYIDTKLPSTVISTYGVAVVVYPTNRNWQALGGELENQWNTPQIGYFYGTQFDELLRVEYYNNVATANRLGYNQLHTISITPAGVLTVDGTTYSMNPESHVARGYLKIGAATTRGYPNPGNIQPYYMNGRIYSVKFFDMDNEIYREFIPIKYGSTYAMYETCLSETVIYDKSGTGAFTGGGTETPLTYEHGASIVSVSLSSGQSSTVLVSEGFSVETVISGVPVTDDGLIEWHYNFTGDNGINWEYYRASTPISNPISDGTYRAYFNVYPVMNRLGTNTYTGSGTAKIWVRLLDNTQDVYFDSYADFGIPYISVRIIEPLVNLTWLNTVKYHYPSDTFNLSIQSVPGVTYQWKYKQISPSVEPISGVISTNPTYLTTADNLNLIPGNTYEFYCYATYTGSTQSRMAVKEYVANQTVTVWEDPEPNTPGGPLVPVAVPYTATLTATSVNERMVSKYVWQQQIGGTWTDVYTGTQYEPSLSVPGAYPFRFVAYGKNEVNVTSPVITINGGFGPYAVITQPLNGAEILSGEIPLLGIVGGTDATYTWSFGRNVISHGTESGTVDAQQSDINSSVIYDDARPEKKTITLTVSNIYGNPAVYTIQIIYGNTRITIRDPAHSEITPVDASGMYGLINDTKPQSEVNQMPDIGRMVSDIVKPFTNIMGEWFYLALFAIPYLIIFLRQKNILIPSIIGVLFAAWLLVFLPGVAMKAAIGIIVLCVAGGIFGLYAKR